MFYTVKITDFGLSKVTRELLGKEGCQWGWGIMMMVGLEKVVEDGGRVVMGVFCFFFFNVVE